MATHSSDEQTNGLPSKGLLKWEVTGDLLEQFKDAEAKKEFVSPDFKTDDGTTWRVQFYPRGKTSDHCSFFLQSVTLAQNKARIGVNYCLNVLEVDWTNESAETFVKDGDTWGKNDAFKHEKIDDLSTLTIQCVVEETMDLTE
eukprot:315067_1